MSSLSIITINYNNAEGLQRTIDSVMQQTFDDFEYIIIIDGGSTDGSIGIIKQYDTRIAHWVSEKDNGVYDAMNKGINLAIGEWLYFMGSDDVLYNETVFTKMAKELEDDVDIVYGDVVLKNCKKIYSGESSLMKLMRDEISICHQAIFYRRTVFEKLGNYNRHLRKSNLG